MELEKRLTETISRLASLKNDLSPLVQSIEVSDSLFDIAETCGVEVTSVRSSLPSNEKLNGARYSALSLTVTLEGDVPNMLRFVRDWTKEYHTGVVKSVNVKATGISDEMVGEAIEEEEDSIEDEIPGAESEKPTADVQFIIYTYQGD